jgi:hypothetical protein
LGFLKKLNYLVEGGILDGFLAKFDFFESFLDFK